MGAELTTLSDPAARSFDDTGLSTQGVHAYAVQALSGGSGRRHVELRLGDVRHDRAGPRFGKRHGEPEWLDLAQLAGRHRPGAWLRRRGSYVVRRASGSSAPPDTSSGYGDLHADTPANACIDGNTKNGTLYGYGVFAINRQHRQERRQRPRLGQAGARCRHRPQGDQLR